MLEIVKVGDGDKEKWICKPFLKKKSFLINIIKAIALSLEPIEHQDIAQLLRCSFHSLLLS